MQHLARITRVLVSRCHLPECPLIEQPSFPACSGSEQPWPVLRSPSRGATSDSAQIYQGCSNHNSNPFGVHHPTCDPLFSVVRYLFLPRLVEQGQNYILRLDVWPRALLNFGCPAHGLIDSRGPSKRKQQSRKMLYDVVKDGQPQLQRSNDAWSLPLDANRASLSFHFG
jgi:hypothetical protein